MAVCATAWAVQPAIDGLPSVGGPGIGAHLAQMTGGDIFGRLSVLMAFLAGTIVISRVFGRLIQTRGYHGAWIVLLNPDGTFKTAAQMGWTAGFGELLERMQDGTLPACAQKALAVFEKEKGKVDIVFSDVVLPSKSGLQLADELLARHPNLHVLLSSGYTDQKSQWSVIQERGYGFVQKPYAVHDLPRTIREVIEPN